MAYGTLWAVEVFTVEKGWDAYETLIYRSRKEARQAARMERSYDIAVDLQPRRRLRTQRYRRSYR